MVHSFKVAATLAAYRCVAAGAAAHLVQYPTAANSFLLGITQDTVKDTTGAIAVAGPGEKSLLFFNDTCTAGALVGSDSSGRGVPYTIAADTTTSLTITSAYIGVLVGPTVAATGTLAEVYISPGIAKGTR